MSEKRKAIASHSTPTDDGAWDAGANERKLSNDAGEATYRKAYAYVDPQADPDTKAAYKFLHHFVSDAGEVGAAATRACSATIAVLNGGRGGADIPDEDRQGVWDHVARHMRDADMEPPELKSSSPPISLRAARVARMEREQLRSHRSIELRSVNDGTLQFSGYASTFEDPYEREDFMGTWTEEFAATAFDKTLAERADVRLLLEHEGLPLARTKSGTLSLSADGIGLLAEAPLNPSDPDVQRIVPKMARGDLAEMSIAFRAVKQHWNDDETHRRILEAKLYDVSIVTFPGNPNTSASLRAADLVRELATADPEALVLEARGAGGLSRAVLEEASARLAALIEQLFEPDPTMKRDTASTMDLEMARRQVELLELSGR